MTPAMRMAVRVPATSANLGPGFDCMGIALNLYNEMSLDMGVPFAVEIVGESAAMLPLDRTNVVVECIDKVLDKSGSTAAPRDWRLRLNNRIPVGSGLGSSASAIVGGLLLGNALLHAFDPARALPVTDVLRLATALEGHPDNVTPALLGGARLSCPDEKQTHTFSIPVPSTLHFVVAVPYFSLFTEESRKVVPHTLARADAVFNVAQAARLTLALCAGNIALLAGGFGDRLHEPYRQALIPGFGDVKQAALRQGAIAVTLSGAGPTLLAWCDDEGTAWKVADQMTLAWREHGIPCDATVQQVEPNATTVRVVDGA